MRLFSFYLQASDVGETQSLVPNTVPERTQLPDTSLDTFWNQQVAKWLEIWNQKA
jgi:hypothetical protein